METCLICNVKIPQPTIGRPKKFCSTKCKEKYRYVKEFSQACKHCEKLFNGSKKQYCSIECRKAYNALNHKTYLMICGECNIMYEAKKTDSAFCSRTCRGKHEWKNKEIFVKTCVQCNNSFETRNEDTQYCSPLCINL